MTDAYARVALPLPLHNGYLYHIPEPLRGSVTAGHARRGPGARP